MKAALSRPGILQALIVGCGVMAALMGGCNDKVVSMRNSSNFESTVMRSNRPVLVNFYKDGCALCGMMAPVMDRLADEYDGKATFVNYELMNLVFISTNPELRDRFDVWVYPTVVLIVDGQVKKKWVVHYNMDDYRHALDEALGVKPPASATARIEKPAGQDNGQAKEPTPVAVGAARG